MWPPAGPLTGLTGPSVEAPKLQPCETCGRTQGQHGLLSWLRCGLDTPPSFAHATIEEAQAS